VNSSKSAVGSGSTAKNISQQRQQAGSAGTAIISTPPSRGIDWKSVATTTHGDSPALSTRNNKSVASTESVIIDKKAKARSFPLFPIEEGASNKAENANVNVGAMTRSDSPALSTGSSGSVSSTETVIIDRDATSRGFPTEEWVPVQEVIMQTCPEIAWFDQDPKVSGAALKGDNKSDKAESKKDVNRDAKRNQNQTQSSASTSRPQAHRITEPAGVQPNPYVSVLDASNPSISASNTAAQNGGNQHNCETVSRKPANEQKQNQKKKKQSSSAFIARLLAHHRTTAPAGAANHNNNDNHNPYVSILNTSNPNTDADDLAA